MDLSPDKRFAPLVTVDKKMKEIREKRDEARISAGSNVQEVLGKLKGPNGLFSAGRVSNLSSTVTAENQEVARKRGDLLQLLSSQSPPSIETLFKSLETDHKRNNKLHVQQSQAQI